MSDNFFFVSLKNITQNLNLGIRIKSIKMLNARIYIYFFKNAQIHVFNIMA